MTTSHDSEAATGPASTVDMYADLARGFGDVLRETTPAGWDAASPCEGWTGRDVVGHVIDTQREFVERHDIDLGAPPALDDPVAAWEVHSTALRTAFADPAVAEKTFDGHFGPTTVGQTLLRFYGFDMIAHRWDVAVADGRLVTFTDDELGTMEQAIAGFGPALYSEGVCAPAVDVPDDADRQTKVLAALGRAPR